MGTVLLTGTDEDCFLRESLVMSLTTIYSPLSELCFNWTAFSSTFSHRLLNGFTNKLYFDYFLKITGDLNMIFFHSCKQCSNLMINCLNFA